MKEITLQGLGWFEFLSSTVSETINLEDEYKAIIVSYSEFELRLNVYRYGGCENNFIKSRTFSKTSELLEYLNQGGYLD